MQTLCRGLFPPSCKRTRLVLLHEPGTIHRHFGMYSPSFWLRFSQLFLSFLHQKHLQIPLCANEPLRIGCCCDAKDGQSSRAERKQPLLSARWDTVIKTDLSSHQGAGFVWKAGTKAKPLGGLNRHPAVFMKTRSWTTSLDVWAINAARAAHSILPPTLPS